MPKTAKTRITFFDQNPLGGPKSYFRFLLNESSGQIKMQHQKRNQNHLKKFFSGLKNG
jgi:hypothetical protein